MIDIRVPVRTVPQIPVDKAARFAPAPAPKRVIPASTFPVARQILEADTPRAVIAIVLRLPDQLVLGHTRVLQQACVEVGCQPASDYLELRCAAANAIRDPDGRLPSHVVDTLELWRRGLLAAAGGPA